MICNVAKSGGKTWMKIFKKINENRIETFADLSEEDKEEVLRVYTKFLVIRDPFERLLSAFKDKLENTPQKQFVKIANDIKELYNLKREANVEFWHFVNFLTDPESKDALYNNHWNLISNICYPCKIKYNHIGSYDTIVEDSNFILQAIGINNVSFPDENPTISSDELSTYYQTVSVTSLKRLSHLYKRDLELFDYDPQKYYEMGKIP